VENWYIRLKEIRDKHLLTQQDLAVAVNKDVTRISRYEKGKGAKTMPAFMKQGFLSLFSKDEIKYIDTGEVTESKNINIKQSGKNSVGMVHNARDMHIGDRINEPNTTYGDAVETVSLPYYPEVYASAGGGAMVYESLAHTQPMQLSKSFVEDFLGISTQKNMHILNVKGDSMEPTILDGELIFVLPLNGDGIIDGNIYVMMYKDEIYVKRVRREAFSGTYKLSSDNDAVDDINLTEQQSSECQIIGEVVGQMRRRG
jgi:phage repressor protein C with HTH and peptisase S24 domain